MLNDKLHYLTPQKISSIYNNVAGTPNPANVDLQTVFHAQLLTNGSLAISYKTKEKTLCSISMEI